MKTVGCYLSKSKYQDLNWAVLEELAKEESINFVRLDFEQPLPHLDLVISKWNPDLAKEQTDNNSKERIRRFEEYVLEHPALVQLDPLVSQRGLTSRKILSEAVLQAEQSLVEFPGQVHSPGYRTALKEEDYSNLISGLQFPLIVKTLDAGGSSDSHVMAIVFDEPGSNGLTSGIHSLKPPVLIQEYYNHNSTIFKCYVLGSHVEVDVRPSVKNFFPSADHSPLIFDSQKPFPGPVPPLALVRELALALGRQLGVSLFGFDMITNRDTGRHAVIDVNYFPGYKGFPKFHEKMLELVKTKLG